MKKTILLLAIISTFNLASTSFSQMRPTLNVEKIKISQKYFYAKRAAERGNPHAQFDLGLMYAKGEGVVKNERLAFSYFHKAARQNHVAAKFYMGLSFAQGRGVRKQTQLARYWFKLAAKAGHPTAMAYLASIERKIRPQYGQNRRVALLTNLSSIRKF